MTYFSEWRGLWGKTPQCLVESLICRSCERHFIQDYRDELSDEGTAKTRVEILFEQFCANQLRELLARKRKGLPLIRCQTIGGGNYIGVKGGKGVYRRRRTKQHQCGSLADVEFDGKFVCKKCWRNLSYSKYQAEVAEASRVNDLCRLQRKSGGAQLPRRCITT